MKKLAVTMIALFAFSAVAFAEGETKPADATAEHSAATTTTTESHDATAPATGAKKHHKGAKHESKHAKHTKTEKTEKTEKTAE